MPARSAYAPMMRDLSLVRDCAQAQRVAQTNLVLSFVHLAHGVHPSYLIGPSRGSHKLSEARQVFQYLSHISFGHSYSELALVSRRDRTSIAHACHKIEDMRDDPKIDRALYFAEMALAAIFSEDWEVGDGPC